MYQMMTHKKKMNHSMKSYGPHHMAPKSQTLMPLGKAIPTGQTGMNWTEHPGGQKAGLVRSGKARTRRTMRNRTQGTGHAGSGGGRRFSMPRPDANGYY